MHLVYKQINIIIGHTNCSSKNYIKTSWVVTYKTLKRKYGGETYNKWL